MWSQPEFLTIAAPHFLFGHILAFFAMYFAEAASCLALSLPETPGLSNSAHVIPECNFTWCVKQVLKLQVVQVMIG
jgi:hypothetical protein